MTEHERNLVRRAERFARIDEVRHDQTAQRKFERTFLSLDWVGAEDSGFDYGDGGRQMRALVRKLDAPWREHVREHRFQSAMWKLRRHPELQKTLRAIRHYIKCEKIFSALQIKAEVHEKRFFHVTEIHDFTTCILEGVRVRGEVPRRCASRLVMSRPVMSYELRWAFPLTPNS